jgi:phosphoribosyl 1,2-cyclic phosphate phosphodiesterase
MAFMCRSHKITQLDIFVLTHGHADHITGMDDLRRFCDMRGGDALPTYSTEEGISRVLSIFPYAIAERAISRGYAAFKLIPMPARLEFPQGTIQTTLLPHGGMNTLGLIFTEKSSGKKFVYYTDNKRLTHEAMELARGADALVLDGLRPLPHPTHMSIPEAIEVAQQIAAPQTWLTHLTHLTDHATAEAELPAGIKLAYDGLRLTL